MEGSVKMKQESHIGLGRQTQESSLTPLSSVLPLKLINFSAHVILSDCGGNESLELHRRD